MPDPPPLAQEPLWYSQLIGLFQWNDPLPGNKQWKGKTVSDQHKLFQEQLNIATNLVNSWPLWKQNILENSAKPTVDVPRVPVDNFETEEKAASDPRMNAEITVAALPIGYIRAGEKLMEEIKNKQTSARTNAELVEEIYGHLSNSSKEAVELLDKVEPLTELSRRLTAAEVALATVTEKVATATRVCEVAREVKKIEERKVRQCERSDAVINLIAAVDAWEKER